QRASAVPVAWSIARYRPGLLGSARAVLVHVSQRPSACPCAQAPAAACGSAQQFQSRKASARSARQHSMSCPAALSCTQRPCPVVVRVHSPSCLCSSHAQQGRQPHAVPKPRQPCCAQSVPCTVMPAPVPATLIGHRPS
ncbi:Unknown protein, partial [Striga hermonthica]